MVVPISKTVIDRFISSNDLRDYEKDFVLNNKDEIKNMLLNTAFYKEYPIIFAYMVGKEPIAIWGANVFWEGVCETYAFFTNKSVNEHKVTVSREAKKYGIDGDDYIMMSRA